MVICEGGDDVVQINVYGATLAAMLQRGVNIPHFLDNHGFADCVIFEVPRRKAKGKKYTAVSESIPHPVDVEVKEEEVDDFHSNFRSSTPIRDSIGEELMNCTLSTIYYPGNDVAPRPLKLCKEEAAIEEKEGEEGLEETVSSSVAACLLNVLSQIATVPSEKEKTSENSRSFEKKQMSREELQKTRDTPYESGSVKEVEEASFGDQFEDADEFGGGMGADFDVPPIEKRLEKSMTFKEEQMSREVLQKTRDTLYQRISVKEEAEESGLASTVNDCLLAILDQVCAFDPEEKTSSPAVAEISKPNVLSLLPAREPSISPMFCTFSSAEPVDSPVEGMKSEFPSSAPNGDLDLFEELIEEEKVLEEPLPTASFYSDNEAAFYDCSFGDEFEDADEFGGGMAADLDEADAPELTNLDRLENGLEKNVKQEKRGQIEEAEVKPVTAEAANPASEEPAPPAKKRAKIDANGKYLYCKFGNCRQEIVWKPSYGSARFLRHAQTHISWPTLRCGLCPFQAEYEDKLRYHHKRQHPGSEWVKPTPCEGPEESRKMLVLWKKCFPTLDLHKNGKKVTALRVAADGL